MNKAWFGVRPNGSVGEITRSLLWIINAVEILVKKIVKAFMNLVCLIHQDSVTF